jgi:hypothetical protein
MKLDDERYLDTEPDKTLALVAEMASRGDQRPAPAAARKTSWTPITRCSTPSMSTERWKDTVLVPTGQTVDINHGRDQPRLVDGPLPHRRAPRERDDAPLRGRGVGARRSRCQADRDQSASPTP